MDSLHPTEAVAATTSTASSCRTCHIAAIPYPGRGHINPMMNLCRLLDGRDNITITVIVTDEWLDLLSSESPPHLKSNVQLRSIPNVLPSERTRGDNYAEFMRAVFTNMSEPVGCLLDGLDPPADVVVADALLLWVVDLCEQRNIPVVCLWTESASVLWALYTFERLDAADQLPADFSAPIDESISKEKIMARIKTWNKYYQEISAMLNISGFGWDWERNVVKVDSEDVWANYVQAHPTVKHYRSKVIVNWGDLAMICGIDRATGAHAATATEAVNEIHIDDSVDENVEEEIEPQVSKKKKTSAVDKIADAVSSIARNLEHESTVSSQPTPIISRADRIYAVIAAIPSLSEEEIIDAIDMLSVDERKSDVFMALPVPIRRTWLRIHLLD